MSAALSNVINTQSTAAYGSMVTPKALMAIIILGSGIGLSQPATAGGIVRTPSNQTSSALPGQLAPFIRERSTASAIMEIRRLSGLTWDELGELFSVSRRSVHHWANGKTISAYNEYNIYRTLGIMRSISKGSSKDVRELLLSPNQNGQLLFDLIKSGNFEEAQNYHYDEASFSVPSVNRTNRKRNLHPADLLGSMQDRPIISGQGKATRYVPVPGKKE